MHVDAGCPVTAQLATVGPQLSLAYPALHISTCDLHTDAGQKLLLLSELPSSEVPLSEVPLIEPWALGSITLMSLPLTNMVAFHCLSCVT